MTPAPEPAQAPETKPAAAAEQPLPPYVPTPIAASVTPPAPAPSRAEARACAARAGRMDPVCLDGRLECVVRYGDGGKRCVDGRDCVGACLYEGEAPPPAAKAVGACQRTSDPCGCKAPIVNGRVRPPVCVD